MSVVHETDLFYYEIRNLAVKAEISQAMIQQANIAYNDVRILIVKIRWDSIKIPDLQDAIMELPAKLIGALGVTRAKEHREIRKAIMELPAQLIQVLEGTMSFETAVAN